MKLKSLLVVLLSTFFLFSCGHSKRANSVLQLLEESTGQGHSIAKKYTEKAGYVVFQNNATGEYVAYNVSKFDKGSMHTLSSYERTLGANDVVRDLAKSREFIRSGYWQDDYDYYYYDVYDSYCDCYVTEVDRVYVGSYWVDTSHYVTYFYGNGFRFNSGQGLGKDLDTFAALKEAAVEKFVSYKLKSTFSLSASRADELAKMATRYKKLESIRELTSSEKNEFSQKALGVKFDEIEGAIKQRAQGSDEAYNALLSKAAAVNKTTPEQIGTFFSEYVLD